MRKALVGIVLLEGSALVALLALQLLGLTEHWRRDPPPVPVFRPPVHDAVIGDTVRYERRHPATGAVLGYLDYEVVSAVDYEGGTLGREFVVRIVRTDAGAAPRDRLIRIQPGIPFHGFLPPRFEETDAYPSGARPVVKTIRTARVPWKEGKKPVTLPGFLVEAVIPRESLEEVKERFWMSPKAAVFGVTRWERPDEVLVLHRSEKHGEAP